MAVNKLPAYPDSRKIEISDYRYITPILRDHPHDISDLSFTNIFAWASAYEYRISECGGHIIIHGMYKQKPFFLPPIGDLEETAEVVLRVFELSGNRVLACAPESLARELAKIGKFRIKSDRANWDYVYKSSNLAELPGSRYHSKRNLIRQFTNKYQAHIEELNTNNCWEALEYSERWCEKRNCDSDEGLQKEKCAIFQMLTHFEALRLHGVLVRIGGEICGLAMGEELNPDTYVIHVEKGDHHCRGIYQYINQQIAVRAALKYKWVNREQDLGVEGLRKAKLSYNPARFVKKFKIDYIGQNNTNS